MGPELRLELTQLPPTFKQRAYGFWYRWWPFCLLVAILEGVAGQLIFGEIGLIGGLVAGFLPFMLFLLMHLRFIIIYR